MELNIPAKRFIHVEYPGVVKDETKMLHTLGGESHVSEVFSKEGKRLELRLRPNDPFCKPACADRQETTSLLLRVRRRKKKKTKNKIETEGDTAVKTEPCKDCKGERPECENCQYEHDTKIVGYSDVSYTFSSLMDFQYLPCTKQEDGSYKSLSNDLLLRKITSRSWMDKPAPLFLTPPIFSRIDQPLEYCYREGPKHRPGYEDPMKGQPAHLIGIARQRRPHYTIFMNFTDESVPTGPMAGASDKINSKRVDKSQLEKVQQLFQERPIWSKNGIRSQPGLHLAHDQLKHILPFVGYFWVNGPWRALWTRFSYDPRRDPKSKVYQLVDYRVRQRVGDEGLKIKSKRSSYVYTLPTQITRRNHSSVATIKQDTFSVNWMKEPDNVKDKEQESMYRFWPGCRPPYRQMFYQLCDVDLDEVRELVNRNNGQETVCTERDGWCIPEYQEKCRAILIKYVQQVLNEGNKTSQKLQELSKKQSKRNKIRKGKSSDVKFYPEEQEGGGEEEDEEEDPDNESLDEDEEEELEANEMETELLDLMEGDVTEEEEEDEEEGEESG